MVQLKARNVYQSKNIFHYLIESINWTNYVWATCPGGVLTRPVEVVLPQCAWLLIPRFCTISGTVQRLTSRRPFPDPKTEPPGFDLPRRIKTIYEHQNSVRTSKLRTDNADIWCTNCASKTQQDANAATTSNPFIIVIIILVIIIITTNNFYLYSDVSPEYKFGSEARKIQ